MGATKLMTAAGGGITLDAASTATDKTITVPAVTDTMVTRTTNVNSGTAVASTSGTSIDFTGIPSWVKRITVMLTGVSTNGTSLVQIQIGSGSITTSGYAGGYSQISGTTIAGNNHTSGVIVQGRADASNLSVGSVQISLVTANTYVASSNVYNASYGGYMTFSDSYVSLSGTLDRVRITTVNGTDTFDAGSINILYE